MITKGSIFRWILAVIILLVAVYYIDWPLIIDSFSLIHLVVIILVQPLQLLIIFLSSIRFALLAQGHTANLLKFFQVYLLSVGLNTFIPGRLSEFIKISFLKEKAGVAGASSLAALFLERVTDLLFVGLVISLGLGSMWVDLNRDVVLFISAIVLLLILLLPKIEQFLLDLMGRLPGKRFHSIFKNTVTEAIVRVQGKEFPLSVGLSAVIWIATFVLVYIVLKVLHGSELGFGDALLVYSAMVLGRAIPGLPGGIGTFEAAVVFAMNQIGYEFAEALTTALALHASQLLVVTLISLIIFIRDGTGIKSMIVDAKKLGSSS